MQDLGAFELVDRLATGGMGQVWNGRHRRSGRAVAIKVIGDPERVRSLQQFEQEVRAVAKLDHPNIVAVLDHGRVADGTDAPFLVMERARTSLASELPGDWSEVRRVLASVLDGLAHSHARGVLHRDLKPSNILVFEAGTYKLADFGIAVALQQLERANVSGTPAYMAPEMLQGRWRRYGPWTDLYAVGVLAWELVTGERPFEAEDVHGFRTAHLHQAPPPFRPLFDVPQGLEAWLLVLLRKDPATRFQRAVDAAAALVALGEAMSGPARRDAQAPVSSLTFPSTLSQTATLDVQLATVLPPLEVDEPAEAPPPAPMPSQWRQSTHARWDLTDAGLGLYGLRAVPMVDRDQHRDQLWQGLRAAREGGSRAFLLTGTAGTGKSRLARWLCERSHETGGALVLTARHGSPAGPRDGVLPMLVRFLRAEGLERGALARHLETALPRADPALRLELVDALMPLRGRPQLDGVTGALVRHLAEDRPVVLWLDDLHHSEASAGVATHLVEAAIPGLVLVGTVRGDAEHGPALGTLCHHPATTVLPVRGLEGADRRELVTALLGLEDDLVHEVEARTDGNPLFAVQLVADWVQRSILVPRASGFALEPGAPTPPPRAVRQVWSDRVRDLLEHRPPADRRALWMAAVLGRDVATSEWAGACGRAGIAVPEDLPSALEVRHLARVGAEGWSFAHGMLVETLLLQAEPELPALRSHAGAELCEQARGLEEAGWAAAADTLLERAQPLLEDDATALGQLRALWGPVKRKLGQPERALELLNQALAASSGADAGRVHRSIGVAFADLGDHAQARLHYELARPLLEDEPLEAAQLMLELGHSYAARNEHDDAIRTLTAALERIGDRDVPRMAGIALCNLGVVYSDTGDLDRSKACYERSQELLSRAGDQRTLAMTYTNLAIVMHTLGRTDEVQPLLEKALGMHRALANRRSEGIVLQNLGLLAEAEGRLVEARDFLEQGIQAARAVRNPRSTASGLASLATVLQGLGEHEAAVSTAREAIDVATSIDHPLLCARALGELGETLRVQGRLDEAVAVIERALAQAERADDVMGRALHLATLLSVEAEQGRAQAAERRERIEAALERPTDPIQCGLVHCHLCRAAVYQGDLDQARAQLERASSLVERLRMAPNSALGRAVAEARGLLERRQGSRATLT